MTDASISDGGASPVIHDAGIAWDGSHVRFDAGACADAAADPGDPPADCVPPCVWKLMKECRLSSCCGEQIEPWDSGLPFAAHDFSCDEQGVLIDVQSPFHAQNTFAYKRGVLCYSTHTGYGTGFVAPVTWQDANGNVVATEASDRKSYDCNGTTYSVDTTQPKCAPWFAETCVPGTCAGKTP